MTEGEEKEDQSDEREGRGEEKVMTRFRSIAARCSYLAADRPDIQFATRRICAAMSAPKQRDWTRLKRLGTYLLGKPIIKCHFEWQEMPSAIYIQCDSDWAADRATRKSVSGGAIYLGRHLIK